CITSTSQKRRPRDARTIATARPFIRRGGSTRRRVASGLARSIGIDDASARAQRPCMASSADDADEFAELFPAIYLRFHRRDDKQPDLTAASRAVLTHLSLSGPVTVGEAAAHLGRAQSVVSEIFDQLEEKQLVERMTDPDDRRRVQVWLTDRGVTLLARDRD